jgi:CheY-like chemotaxis protein
MSRLRSWLLPSAQKAETASSSSGALPLLAGLVVLGLGSILVYALQSGETFGSVAGVGLMVAGAALVLGGLVGFLFGIPRTLVYDRPVTKEDTATRTEAGEAAADFRANTNLEQISDWLTKILVGVGLTQLSQIPQTLDKAANAIQAGLGNSPQNHVFALAILVYFPVCGFLVGYLWTRLFLPGAFTKAELARIRERERNQAEQKAIYNVSQTVSDTVVAARQVKTGLWVDDNPANNASLQRSFEKLLGLKFDLSLSTDDALVKLKSRKYEVVISDMGRPPDQRAGYTLLSKMKELDAHPAFMLYARGASDPINQAEAINRGAVGSTSSPQELLELLRSVLESAG